MTQHQGGLLEHECSSALRDVVQAVRQTGKSGKLLVEIEVRPASKGAGNALSLSHQVTPKLPKLDKESSIFFADDNYNLSSQARLRYKIEGGKILFRYEIIDGHLVLRKAAEDLISIIQSTTKIEPYVGTPA